MNMRFFTSDLRRNIIKIVCLMTGLAIGFLLVAKIYFEQTFDSFIPDVERLYIVTESVTQDGEYHEYPQTPGAIAPGLKQYVPQVETSTRTTNFLIGGINITTDDDREFHTECIAMADSCFFDVIGTRILQGDPHEVLATVDQCMIPRSLAELIGDDVVGQQLCAPDFSKDYKITIGGVYEDFPLNSSFENVVFLSLPTIARFSVDGRENWMGNDRYRSFVKLFPGTTPEEMAPSIRRMLEDHIDRETLDTLHFNIHLQPLADSHAKIESVRTMVWILVLLAVVMLMCAALNYLLIVIVQMSSRAKEMAVRKCYGTSNGSIFVRIIGESIFFMAISIGMALLIVTCCSELSRRLLGYTASQLLTTPGVWYIEGAVCLVLLIVTGVIPAWFYTRTPVAHAFRYTASKHRVWKKALLGVQFFAVGTVISLLVLVGRQYTLLNNADMGIKVENVGMTILPNYLSQETRRTLVNELKKLSCVANVASSMCDFTQAASGNNVWLDGKSIYQTVNVADLYYANRDIVDVLEMPLKQGATFRENADSTVHEVLVEERFVDMLRDKFDVKDPNIVGQKFHITEHVYLDGSDEFTICGVVGNMRRGSFNRERADTRAGVLFPTLSVMDNLYVRFNHLDPVALHEAQEVIDRISETQGKILLTPMQAYLDVMTEPVRSFSTAVLVIGLAILLIAMIGLIGYTADEVQQRKREIAIRKVNGFSSSRIVAIFCGNVIKIAIPALICGGIAAIWIGQRWLSQFTEQVPLAPWVTVLCLMVLLILIIGVVIFNSLNIARANPVDTLRAE